MVLPVNPGLHLDTHPKKLWGYHSLATGGCAGFIHPRAKSRYENRNKSKNF